MSSRARGVANFIGAGYNTLMIRGLGPISGKDARLLILGSMPGKKSIERQQYYAHPHNAFWKIMGRIFGETESYQDKTDRLMKHRIALWDVIQTCKRKGSLDSAIKNPKYNNIESFLRKHPKIEHILLNGTEAAKSYIRYTKGKLSLPHTRLPSTSPANTMGFELKLKAWKKMVRRQLD
jgi:hypoxanthine-DNA glycosylase